MPDDTEPKDATVYEDGDIRVAIYTCSLTHSSTANEINTSFRINWRGNGDKGTMDVQPWERAVETAEAKFAELLAKRETDGHYIDPVSKLPSATKQQILAWAGAVPLELMNVPINLWPTAARARLLAITTAQVFAVTEATKPKDLKTLLDIVNIIDPQGAPQPKQNGSNVNITLLSGALPPLKVVRDVAG